MRLMDGKDDRQLSGAARKGEGQISGDARSARSRAALSATLVALLEEKPFDQVTIREIAAKAKIGYATFFRHYPSKEALLNDLAADQISTLTEMTEPLLHSADTRITSRALCTYVWEHRKIWAALLTGGAAGTVKLEFIRQMRQLAAKQGHFDSWLPGDLRVAFSVAATLEILAWWLEQTESVSIEQMADILDQLVVAPSLADAPDFKTVTVKQVRAPRKSGG
jgi:AcrR family transcriptional regulator